MASDSNPIDRFAPVLERIGNGESLRKACAAEGVYTMQVLRAIHADEAFRSQYASAREAQADAHFDMITEAADELYELANSGRLVDLGSAAQATVNAYRSRVDALKWAASKLKPKVYGDRIEVAEKRDVTVTVMLGAPTHTELRDVTPLTLDAHASPTPALPSQALEGDPTPLTPSKRKGGPRGAKGVRGGAPLSKGASPRSTRGPNRKGP